MTVATFKFSETSPSSAGVAFSSQPVQSSSIVGVAWPLDDYDALLVTADLVGATGGSLQVFLQASPDDGINWYDVVAFPLLGAGAPTVHYSAPLSLATNTLTPIGVGQNGSPALAAGSVVNGAFTGRLRLAMQAGAGTTQGAPVVVTIAGQRPRVSEYGR